MKQKFIFFLFFIISGSLSAQTLYTRKDTIAITQDSVTLQAGPFRGKLQWQHSLNSKTWENLINKTKAQLKVAKTAQGYYRAEITESTCLPNYSDTAVIVPKTVNTVILDPEKISGVTLVDRDNDTFTYVLTPNSAANITTNTVLVDADKESDIRVVSGVSQKGDTLKVMTQPGTMEDLFINQDFKLTTELMPPLKGAYLTNSALSKALTDKDGFIHPAEVYDSNGVKLKNAAIDGEIPIVNINKDLSGEKLYSENGVELTITEGSYYLGTVLKCEFNFEQKKFLWTKMPTGKLNSCKFYTDPEKTGANSKLIVQAKASGEVSIDETFVLKPKVFKLPFKFFVGEVPVWMEVKIDLMARVVGYLKSEFSITGGASSNLGIYLGAEYAYGSWNPFFKYSKDFKLYGPDYDGHINYDLRMEVYPRTEITFYYTLGPVLEIVPYLSEHMDCSISGNYNLGLYAGLDARVGVTGNILGYDISNLPMKEYNVRKDTLYEQPSKIEIVSGNNQKGKPNTKLEKSIILKVIDSSNRSIPNVPIHFKFDTGELSDYLPKTNGSGEVSVGWTLGTEGKQSIEAYLEDGNDKRIDKTAIKITAECNSDLASVTTDAISNITETTATCGGNITNDGGSEITARGVCWNTTGEPTIANSKTSNSAGTGTYTSGLSGLTEGTTYYVRAYATNSKGTTYGNEEKFTTSSSTSIVTTISSTTANSATCNSTITSNKTITARGVCWNTTGNPTISDSKTSDGSGTGSFTSSITGLNPNNQYIVRAYAISNNETLYGNQMNFKTSNVTEDESTTGIFTDSRDWKSYKWVKIGTQTWMAENLAYYIDTDYDWDKTLPSYYIYNTIATGVIYNYSAALNACPQGWHMPNYGEWLNLSNYLIVNGFGFGGSGDDIAMALASQSSWGNSKTRFWGSDISGTPANTPENNNASGFSAIPCGYYYGQGKFPDGKGQYSSWWAGELGVMIKYNDPQVIYSGYSVEEGNGHYLRCVKN